MMMITMERIGYDDDDDEMEEVMEMEQIDMALFLSRQEAQAVAVDFD